jgi:hypothetical protein
MTKQFPEGFVWGPLVTQSASESTYRLRDPQAQTQDILRITLQGCCSKHRASGGLVWLFTGIIYKETVWQKFF